MSEFKLEYSVWDPKQYNYLSKEDSIMYDKLKDSDDPKDKLICKLILDKGKESHAEHCRSTY